MALTDPIWNSPAGKAMRLAVVAPRYGWTDLVDSLVPTGRHFQTPDNLPAFDGSASANPTGIPKQRIDAARADEVETGLPPGVPHATFPSYIDDALTCMNSSDPFETNPLCTTTLST